MQLVLRYRTTAERTFYRAMGALEGMRRSRELEKVTLEKHALLKEKKTEAQKRGTSVRRMRQRTRTGRGKGR
jgi:hypothetical protein